MLKVMTMKGKLHKVYTGAIFQSITLANRLSINLIAGSPPIQSDRCHVVWLVDDQRVNDKGQILFSRNCG